MACRYRVATGEELDLLVRMRLAFIQDMHPEYEAARLSQIRAGTEDYIREHIVAGRYIGFFGVETDLTDEAFQTSSFPLDEAHIACAGALLVYTLPPLSGQEGRKVGHVLNFFTRKPYRRRGYGQGLMAFMIDHARADGFSRLFLNATADGAPLYLKIGYQQASDAMTYELRV